MMRIVCILGTKNTNSCTERLFDKISENIKKYDNYDIEKVSFKDYQLLDCQGCTSCFKEGVCPLDNQDDFREIRSILEKADIIFLASPVYLDNVSGVMKTFVDRLAADTHLMKFAGKIGFTLTTTSNSGGDYVKEYMKKMQINLGVKNLENYIFIKSMEKDEDSFVKETAQNIIHELNINNTFSSQELEETFDRWKWYFNGGYGFDFERRFWNQEWVNECDSFHQFANKSRENFHLEKPKKIVYKSKILNLREGKIALFFEHINKIVKIIENYFKVYLEGKLEPRYYLDFLLVLIEAYPMLEEKEKWEEIGYRLCLEIKKDIERNGISENLIGMIGGFGYQVFLVEHYKNITGHIQGFAKTLRELLLEYAYNRAKRYLEESKPTNMKDYDLLYGLSGNVYYLLDFEWDIQNKCKINLILEYLINLTRYHKYNDNYVINFHIAREEQFRLDEKETFPDGNFNFGISHGMLGPLIALSKAYNLGYSILGIQNAIDELFSIYGIFKKYNKGIPIWPTQLQYKDFINKSFTYDIRELRTSWCYGNIGIAMGLYKAAKYMNNQISMDMYKNDLKKILKQELEEYNLDASILCHGYSSIFAIQLAAYRSTNDKEFLMNKEQNLNKILSECLDDVEPENIDVFLHTIFKGDMSMLQGAAGVVLSVLSLFKDNMIYERLLMID